MSSGRIFTWVGQYPSHRTSLLPVFLETKSPKYLSGTKIISSAFFKLNTTFTAFDEVQQISSSALTAAGVFTYPTTAALGCLSFNSRRSSAVIIFARGHPAFLSGISTVLSGDKIDAVSAIKYTQQKTITSALDLAAMRLNSRESPTKS